MNVLTILLPFLSALSVLASTNQGTPCLAACTKWSNTLTYCYGSFGLSPSIKGLDYSNQFLGCLCTGRNVNGTWGNDTMIVAASTCESCSTTPKEIKANLATFLTLCQIQAQNGTAANATIFAPLKYVTADDPKVGISAEYAATSSASRSGVIGGSLFGALVLAAAAVTMA